MAEINEGYLNENMEVARIMSHGQIADLAGGFKLTYGIPFSVFIAPKAGVAHSTLLVDCQLYQDNASSPCPINTGDWCEPSILEIAIDAIDLTDYDVFWGAGHNVVES